MEQTYIYGCGKNNMGQLTLEAAEILTPTEIIWTEEVPVMSISTADEHTIFLCMDGTAYKSGWADGALEESGVITKRTRLPNFERINNIHTSEPYVQVCCAGKFSVAASKLGRVFSWSNNSEIVRSLLLSHIIRVACSHQQALLLSNIGEVFTLGLNTSEQMENSNSSNQETPTQISSLKSTPIVFIACGGHHSLAISAIGTVYAWGHNEYGQLGLNHTESLSQPTPLFSLSSFNISYIACGDNFTMFLSKDGGLFSCGCGTEGQLGHGRTTNELLPIQIAALMGSVVTQVACGSTHTLAYVPAKNCIYAFGSGVFGQLGTGNTVPILVPTIITGPWQTKIVKEIFCGAHQSFVLATAESAAKDLRVYEENQQMVVFTEELAECLAVKQGVPIDPVVFNKMVTLSTSIECWNASFILDDTIDIKEDQISPKFNFEMATRVFEKIATVENSVMKELISNGIAHNILGNIEESLIKNEDQLRFLLILPLYHEMHDNRNYQKFQAVFARIIRNLEEEARTIFFSFLVNSPLNFFKDLISIFKKGFVYIVQILYESDVETSREEFPKKLKKSEEFNNCLQLLSSLHALNAMRTNKVPHEEFYCFGLMDFFSTEYEYYDWITMVDKPPKYFNIRDYPYLLDLQAKIAVLKTDQNTQRTGAMNMSEDLALAGFLTSSDAFIILRVSRARIVEDTLREIQKFTIFDLKKPLKVQFVGEEAGDAGGVSMEFFMLLAKNLKDPKYKMFKKYESGMLWFSDITLENNIMYQFIGTLIGLAIYHLNIFNIEFPLALYKKVLGENPTLEDLCELSPTIGNSLVDILHYQGDDFEGTYNLYFEISFDVLGTLKTEPLIENGHNIAVTQCNKAEFVDLYIDFIFNKSIESKFDAFKYGILDVIDIRVLRFFTSNELMSLVKGTEDYDWIEFQKNAVYRNGYSEESETVKFFWQVFHELTIEEKKRFMWFLTGTDRKHLQGIREIIIKKHDNVDYLPVAHTCYYTLDLPCYGTKELLELKLKQALEQPQGFGLV